jgi:phosphate uptake regulator
MKRKIIKLAEKTLVVSLPAAWVSAQGLEKGDELEVKTENEKLVLAPLTTTTVEKLTLDIQGLSNRVLRWKLSSFHKQGYDEIELINYSSEQYTIIEEVTQTLFIGFLVTEKTPKRILLGQVAQVDVEEFAPTLRRAFRHVQQMGRELHQAFSTQDTVLLAQLIKHEEKNNKMTNFCERLLNKNLIHKEKGHFWYVIAWNLEKVADSFKHIASSYATTPSTSEELLHLLKNLLDYLDNYAQLLYAFSFPTLVQLSAQKSELEKELLRVLVEGEKNDRILAHYLHMLVLQLADFSASIIAVTHNEE